MTIRASETSSAHKGSRDEDAVLVLSLERCGGGKDADGVLTLDLDSARDGFLVRERAEARRELNSQLDLKRAYLEKRRTYEADMVECRERAEAHAEALHRYEQEDRSRRAALRDKPRSGDPRVRT